MSAIVWLRRDLRLHDHPALAAALASHERVAAVFCLDRGLLKGRHRSGPRTQFLLECLRDLDVQLRERGSRLVVRHGPAESELCLLAGALRARCVHASADVGPYAQRRDARVARALSGAGVALRLHPGLFTVQEPAAIRTRAGGHYTVFTPYYRAWLQEPRRELIAGPSALPPLPARLRRGRLPRLDELGLSPEVAHPAPGGERAARARLTRFLSEAGDYAERRDMPAAEATSGLSPYLHFGCVSPREVEHCLPDGPGPEAFRRQLCWRDFYAQVLLGFPRNTRSEHQQRYRGKLRWSHARGRFAAWCEGRTGYPLVDAGMRQLRQEGWMHNRVRLVVGSFLTKDLGIDWRWGERWFMRLLIDGDEASNNGNWQWIASVGVDQEPPSRRIFNPARQQERFDPQGAYVRRFVPELELVPDRYLAEPWRMPEQVQARARCVIGHDYPRPIVDHARARRDALGRYAVAR